VKWTKIAIVLVIPALALLLLGQSLRSPAVEAKPTTILTITPTNCLTFGSNYDWNDDGMIDPDDGVGMLADCQALTATGKIKKLVGIFGGDTEDVKPEDLAPIDREGGQIHEHDGKMFIVAFVTHDTPVAFFTDYGAFQSSGTSSTVCGPAADPGSDYQDEDCDDDGIEDDGVVVALLSMTGSDPKRGPSTVRVRQDLLELEEEIIVVGEPANIELTAMEPSVQTGAADCTLFTDTPTFMATLGSPTMMPINAKVTDSDGTAITGALVNFEVDDEFKATTAKPLTPTLDSPLGVNAPNALCGTVNTGTVTIKATITDGLAEIGLGLNPSAKKKSAKVEVSVQGMPTDMVLSASPGSLVCDGTATSSVAANLTDAEGNPVLDGNPVRFQAKALGNVSPLDPTSVGGAATTTLTPLSALAGGVAVRATMTLQPIDWEYLLSNYRRLINSSLLKKLIDGSKFISWRNVADECSEPTDDPIDHDKDATVNDGCPEVDGSSESGDDCTNSDDDDDDGAVNDGCPTVGSRPEAHIPMGDEVAMERSLLVACSEAAPAEAAPAEAAPVGMPAISPPATGDGGFLGP